MSTNNYWRIPSRMGVYTTQTRTETTLLYCNVSFSDRTPHRRSKIWIIHRVRLFKATRGLYCLWPFVALITTIWFISRIRVVYVYYTHGVYIYIYIEVTRAITTRPSPLSSTSEKNTGTIIFFKRLHINNDGVGFTDIRSLCLRKKRLF